MFLDVIARASLRSRQPQAPTPRVVTLPRYPHARVCTRASPPRQRSPAAAARGARGTALRNPLHTAIFIRNPHSSKCTNITRSPEGTRTQNRRGFRSRRAIRGFFWGVDRAPHPTCHPENPRAISRACVCWREGARHHKHTLASTRRFGWIRKRMCHVTSCRPPTVAQTEHPTQPSTVCCARTLTRRHHRPGLASKRHVSPRTKLAADASSSGGGVWNGQRTTDGGRARATGRHPASAPSSGVWLVCSDSARAVPRPRQPAGSA